MTKQAWHSKLSQVPRSTVLQSYAYAKAIRLTQKLVTKWAVILINGEEAGIFQLHEGSILWGVFHVCTLDRGPLWFDGYGSPAHISLFFKELDALYPKRFGRSRRFIPEALQSKKIATVNTAGFSKKPFTPYQTIWLDMSSPLEDIRAGLKQKWRNALNKGEKQRIEIDVDPLGTHIGWIIKRYIDDRIEKKYPGPSPKFLGYLLTFCAQEDALLILRAKIDGQAVAGIAFLKHGNSATYQIGWANDQARKLNAMNVLLWQGVQHLKKDKITALDLGGINEETDGLRRFKEGLGGEKATYIGHFS